MPIWPKLFNGSLPASHFATMKALPVLKPPRSAAILSRVFPHRIKYQSLFKFPAAAVSIGGKNQQKQFQSFSTSGARAAKSLIDDEADLSDWVSGLSSKSSGKSKLFIDDSDDDSKGRFSNVAGGRGGGRGGKRRRDSDDGDDRVSDRRGGPREFDGGDRFSRGGFSRGGGRFSRGGGDSGGRFSRGGGESGGRFSRGGGASGGRFSRGGGDSGGRFSRGDRDSNDRFSSRVDRDSSDRYSSRGDRDSSDRFSRGDRDSNDRFSRGGGRFSRGGAVSGGRFSRGGGESNGRFSRGDRDRDSSDRFSRDDRVSGDRFSKGGRDSSDRFSRGGKISSDRFSRGGKVSSDRSSRGSDRGEDSRTEFGRNDRKKAVARGGLMLSEDDDEEETEEFEEEKGYARFKDLIDSEEDSEDGEEDEEEDEDEDDDGDDVEDEDVDDTFKEEVISSKTLRASPLITQEGSDSYLSETRFEQCSVSPLSLRALKDVGFEKMTMVQEATLPVILKGKDVLAKARTGTGKTVAFLLPSIEVVVNSPAAGRDQKRPPITVLVICPTRELASQAAKEANTLLKYHPSIGVQVVIGGTRLSMEQKRLQANPCQILVATPGRLKDHIENTAGFASRLMGVKVLVLDEADHLLDMGFRRDIEKIVAAVPKQRQTLLFSATIPPEVRSICHIALKRDHEYVNTVEEGSEETHAQVSQMQLVAPLENHFPLLYALLKEHMAADVDFKVLVFCTTAMVTRLVADLLNELNLNVREIHSRKPQSYRTRVSDEFRKSKGLILVTSDVSARGVDYPDVTLVIQIGTPSDRQQYIHRLGRTGRKGKQGEGILMLAPWEEFFLSTIKDLPITKASPPLVDPDTKKKVERALSNVEMKNKEAAYQAWLGYYNSNKTVGRDKYKLVELANDFSRSMGLDNPPAIPKLVLGKMGLKNIPGLRTR